jgi:integrase/recombinase XerD
VRERINTEKATREQLAKYVQHLTTCPSPKGPNVLVIDSGVGLSNATIQQRLTVVRLYYDFLVEEGIRKSNPVGRGRYTPGKAFAGKRERGLVRRYKKLPWIPTEQQWQQIVETAKDEPLRNRVMLSLAYDSALRREELCSLVAHDARRRPR